MERVVSAVCLVILCALGQALAQTTTRCSSMLQYGGVCVDMRQDCPAGTAEFAMYSNYIGCYRLDQKCCAGTASGTVNNPDGVIVAEPRTCGLGSLRPSSKILDGQLTGVCDWPFVVSIRGKLSDSSTSQLTYNTTTHACQGVLIDTQWVLTSPFCIFSAGYSPEEAPSRILVVAGEYDVVQVDIDPVTQTPQEQLINAEKVILYPGHEFTTQDEVVTRFDDTKAINSDAIALIKLSEPINGRCSGPVCLPTEEEAANYCAAYDDCVITGWGYSTEDFTAGLRDELLLGRVRLSSAEACDFLTSRLGLDVNRPRGSLCQSPRQANTDSCLGDEGGAVMCSNGYNWIVRGVLPFNMCVNGRYNLYVTDVAPYLEWIKTTMASN